jgi:hypothetical protein
MDAAVMVLMQSMKKGKTGATVKYGTARKACAKLTVLWESSPSGGDDLTLSAGSVNVNSLPLSVLEKDNGINTLRQGYVHEWETLCPRIGLIPSKLF